MYMSQSAKISTFKNTSVSNEQYVRILLCNEQSSRNFVLHENLVDRYSIQRIFYVIENVFRQRYQGKVRYSIEIFFRNRIFAKWLRKQIYLYESQTSTR